MCIPELTKGPHESRYVWLLTDTISESGRSSVGFWVVNASPHHMRVNFLSARLPRGL